jgi:hypothetical protein
MPRPKLEITKDKKSVSLRSEVVDHLLKLGHGNLSAGIEALYRMHLAPSDGDEVASFLNRLNELSFIDAVDELRTRAKNQSSRARTRE